ncbi:MAG: ATP-binding protein [Pseudomonadota bacterium]
MANGAGQGLPDSELLDLTEEAIALFDDGAVMRAANAAFAGFHSAAGDFARAGTSWDIFLLEAARHGTLTEEAANRLRIIENTQLDDTEPPAAFAMRLGGGRSFELRLAALSDGGFALMQRHGVDDEETREAEREAEQLMSKVLEACPANLTMVRIGDGQIMYRSPAATELFGTTRNSREHFAHPEERADFLTALLPDARVDDMRVTGCRRDGSSFPASISARLIDYRGEEVVVANMLDLTDELSMQSEIERQREQIFISEKLSALGELLAGVAHELNNPLSIILGNATMLREDEIAPQTRRRVDKLSDAAERCVAIVRGFLALAREQPLEITGVSARDLIETAADTYRDGAPHDRIALEIDVPSGLPPVMADEVQMVQVLVNLITNAEHAIDGSGTGERVTLRAVALADRDLVEIAVTDDGPGIPKDVRARVFDPLFTTKRSGKGTGVGLAFCHRILTAHGGSIRVDSREGLGATFTLSLPVARAQ